MSIYVGSDVQGFEYDFTGKVANSVAENPLKLYKGSYESGTKPNQLTTIPDLSGNGNTGTVSGATFTGYGTYTSPFAMSFDGVNDSLVINETSNFNFSKISPFSVEYFGKIKGSSSESHLINRHNFTSTKGGYSLLINSSNLLIFSLIGSSGQQSVVSKVIDITISHHIICTFDGVNTLKMYIDGVKVSECLNIVFDSEITVSGQKLTFGVRSYTPSAYSQNDMYYSRIYNKLLIDTEVNQNFQQRYNASGYVTSGLVLDINARSCDSGVSTLPIPTDPLWSEVTDQTTIDKIKTQNENVTITNLDTTNRTASWNGRNLVLQSDTVPAIRDDFAGKVSGNTTVNPNISKSGTENYIAGTINGKTLVNLMGTVGDCESLSGWVNQYGITVSSTQKLYGSNSFYNNTTNSLMYVYKDIICDQTHKYLISAYANITNYTSGALQLIGGDYGTFSTYTTLSFDVSKLNQWQRKSTIITSKSNGGMRVIAGITSNSTLTGYIDGICVYDLTTIYGAGNEPSDITQLERELPFVSGASSVKPSSIKSVGKNLFNNVATSFVNTSSRVTDSNGMLNYTATRSIDSKLIRVKPNTNYFFKPTQAISYQIRGVNDNMVIVEDMQFPTGTTLLLNGNATDVGGSFNTGNFTSISIRLYNNTNVTGFNIQLEEGSSATAYTVYNESTQTVPPAITDLKQIGSIQDTYDMYSGVYTKKISDWVNLDGSMNYNYVANRGGGISKTIVSNSFVIAGLDTYASSNSMIGIKYDSSNLPIYNIGNSNTSYDAMTISNNTPYITVPMGNSGWSEPIVPSQGEIQSYMYGWKMCNADSTSPYYNSEIPYNPSTWAEWSKSAGIVGDSSGIELTYNGTVQFNMATNIKPSTKYGYLYNVISSSLTTTLFYVSSGGTMMGGGILGTTTIGNNKIIATSYPSGSNTINVFLYNGVNGEKIKIKDIRIFELPSGSQIETDFNTLTADQLCAKYTFNGLNPKSWKKITDGTGLTTTLPTSSYAGYTPYKMIYQLATPVVTNNTVTKMTGYPNGSVWTDNATDDTGFSRMTPIAFGSNPLMIPSNTSFVELSDYTNIITNGDGKTYSVTANTLGAVPQLTCSFDMIKETEMKYGTIPANDTASKVQWLKDNISKLNVDIYINGSCASGNKVYLDLYLTNLLTWTNKYWGNSSSLPTKIGLGLTASNIMNYIQSDGFLHCIAYTDPATTTSDKILVLSSHGFISGVGGYIENITKGFYSGVSKGTNDTLICSTPISNQSNGDVIKLFPFLISKTTETGTNSTTLKITNHGLITGDYIWNSKTGTQKISVIDANTITINSTPTIAVGDSIALFHYSETRIAESTIIPSTIYTDYISLDIQLKSPQGYDVLVDSNPRRDAGLSDVVLVKKNYSKFTKDFTGKIAGSVVENPNKVGARTHNVLGNPTDFTGNFAEFNQPRINSILTLNGDSASIVAPLTNGYIPQHVFSFNLIRNFENTYGVIPATDKVKWLRDNVKTLTAKWYGYGSCPSGSKAKFDAWYGSWYSGNTHTNSTVTNLSFIIGSNMQLYIQNDGFVHFIAYTDPSDGITASTIFTDYISLEMELINDNNAITLMNNNSVQINVQTINKTTAYMVCVDLNAITSGVYGGSNSALKSASKNINVDCWCQGIGSNNGVLTNGAKFKTWSPYETLWSDRGNNASNSITKINYNLNLTPANVVYIIDNSNKIYLLLTSQYPSDSSVQSVVNLDYCSVKINFTRTPDVIQPIQVTL